MGFELSVEDRLNFAMGVHFDFVNLMWERFGLLAHPGYCKISIKPLLVSGGYSEPPEISLNDVLFSKDKIRGITCHESGHFLHPFARENHRRGLKLQKKDYLLGEIVANLGVCIYLNERYGNQELSSFLRDSNYSMLIAQRIFERNEGLLAEISKIGMDEARVLIETNLCGKLDINKNPYDN